MKYDFEAPVTLVMRVAVGSGAYRFMRYDGLTLTQAVQRVAQVPSPEVDTWNTLIRYRGQALGYGLIEALWRRPDFPKTP